MTDKPSAEQAPAGQPEREELAKFVIAHGFATGHGDTHADLLGELDWQLTDKIDGLQAQLSTTREMLNVALEYIRQEKLYRAKVPSALGDLEYNEQIREHALMRRSLDAQAETLLNGEINGR